jgi:hypothetical protein
MPNPRTEIRTKIELCISAENTDRFILKEWLDGNINTMLAEIAERARIEFVRWVNAD